MIRKHLISIVIHSVFKYKTVKNDKAENYQTYMCVVRIKQLLAENTNICKILNMYFSILKLMEKSENRSDIQEGTLCPDFHQRSVSREHC